MCPLQRRATEASTVKFPVFTRPVVLLHGIQPKFGCQTTLAPGSVVPNSSNLIYLIPNTWKTVHDAQYLYQCPLPRVPENVSSSLGAIIFGSRHFGSGHVFQDCWVQIHYNKLGRCKSYLLNMKLSITHWQTHWPTDWGRCYRIYHVYYIPSHPTTYKD